jgi:DNA (cytosine-5)-methyltransferase 1
MGDAKPRFAALLAELRGHGYRVAASYLDASRYDVPQKRERVVVIGFRDDLGLDPAAAFPSPGPVCVMRDVGISALVVEEIGRSLTRYGYLHDHIWDGAAPAPTITTRGPGPLSWSVVRVKTPSVQRKATPDDVRRLCGFPEGFDLGDAAFATAALVYGNAVPPGMSAAWATGVHDQLRTRV